ncbi:Gfo/Idh/MocA family protein [Rathayibacter soli]|uniref:Gfo/Idh/MocA family protein n=1 Tax=Rathayibacter soli TaxID=3144168 RepID=UPI0027E4BA3F|nr:Gfo/Idh/MocA family oxidoreductase [Glaciibacter superstes]
MPTIAIIGQGTMARAHARAWSEVGLADRIRYVCAPGTARPIDDAPRAEFVADLDLVIRDPTIDIVSVCTPTPTHADIAIRALACGKNVLLEKPIALNLRDAAAIQDAAAHSEGILMVAHVVRFFGGYEALRLAAQAGEFGRVLSVRAERISGPPAPSPWWHDESQSGGLLVDFAIHDFDQVNLFLGVPRRVWALRASPTGPIEIGVEYTDGGIGQVQTFMGMDPNVPFSSALGLLGTRGSATHQFSGAPDVTASTPTAEFIRLVTAAGVAFRPADATNPYARQALHFLDCVTSHTDSGIAPTNGAILALAVSLAARRSLAEGRPVDVETA